MINRIKKAISKEKGAVPIVEAAFAYPVVIFVVIIFLVLGNMLYQQSRVDSVAVRAAERLAAYYTNPALNGKIPTNAENMKVYPYRYLFGDAGAVAATKKYIGDELAKIGSGLFSGMEISPVIKTCDIKNYIVYQTARVEIEYTINFFPIKLIGGIPLFTNTAACSTSAADPAEFIRNVDMVLDYNEEYGWTDKLKEVLQFTGS